MSDSTGVILEVYDPSKTYYRQSKFDCGNKLINKFVTSSLKKQVRDDLSRCFALLDQNDSDRFIGFYTLTSFAIDGPDLASISGSRLPNKVPCARMLMLGVDKSYQGCSLGSKLLLNAIDRILSVSEELGVFGLYLDAAPEAFDFYVSHGFAPLKERKDPEPTPMFLSMDAVRNA